MRKWEYIYCLPVVADHFRELYAPDKALGRIARAHVNKTAPRRGGIATDNNFLESSNNQDKEFFNRKRVPLPTLVDPDGQFLPPRIKAVSGIDLYFRKPFTFLNSEHYSKCEELLLSVKADDLVPTLMNYTVPVFNHRRSRTSQITTNVPPGCVLALSTLGIKELSEMQGQLLTMKNVGKSKVFRDLLDTVPNCARPDG